MAKLMVDIMQILKLNVKFSTSVLMMEMVASQNTASFAQMELYFSNNILFVNGGLMLIAPLLSSFIP